MKGGGKGKERKGEGEDGVDEMKVKGEGGKITRLGMGARKG